MSQIWKNFGTKVKAGGKVQQVQRRIIRIIRREGRKKKILTSPANKPEVSKSKVSRSSR